MTKVEWAAMLTLEALVTLLILRTLGPRALELGRRFGYWWGTR